MRHKKEITRIRDREFCTLEVELRNRNRNGLELSICGVAGYILTEDQASNEARENWINYFESAGEDEIRELSERWNRDLNDDPELAADFVLDIDGEFHGLDVSYPRNVPDGYEDMVFVCHSCGQIRSELSDYFPEVIPYFHYHLNGMSKLCPHLQKYSLVLQDRLLEQGYDPETAKKIADKALSMIPYCPDFPHVKGCGEKPGSQWWHEPLPQPVIDWFENLESNLFQLETQSNDN